MMSEAVNELCKRLIALQIHNPAHLHYYSWLIRETRQATLTVCTVHEMNPIVLYRGSSDDRKQARIYAGWSCNIQGWSRVYSEILGENSSGNRHCKLTGLQASGHLSRLTFYARSEMQVDSGNDLRPVALRSINISQSLRTTAYQFIKSCWDMNNLHWNLPFLPSRVDAYAALCFVANVRKMSSEAFDVHNSL